MDVEIIGVDSDGLTRDIGEGIFGYGSPDGSLGRGAFMAPKSYANRLRQGVFWNPYSVKSYEAAEPEMQWALEQRPGLPRFPGSSAQGLVLIGPAMGDDQTLLHPTVPFAQQCSQLLRDHTLMTIGLIGVIMLGGTLLFGGKR